MLVYFGIVLKYVGGGLYYFRYISPITSENCQLAIGKKYEFQSLIKTHFMIILGMISISNFLMRL